MFFFSLLSQLFTFSFQSFLFKTLLFFLSSLEFLFLQICFFHLHLQDHFKIILLSSSNISAVCVKLCKQITWFSFLFNDPYLRNFVSCFSKWRIIDVCSFEKFLQTVDLFPASPSLMRVRNLIYQLRLGIILLLRGHHLNWHLRLENRLRLILRDLRWDRIVKRSIVTLRLHSCLSRHD